MLEKQGTLPLICLSCYIQLTEVTAAPMRSARILSERGAYLLLVDPTCLLVLSLFSQYHNWNIFLGMD